MGPPRYGEGGLIRKYLGVTQPWIAGIACAATLLMSSCTKPPSTGDAVAIEKTISPDPAHVGPETINLKLSDATGTPLTGAQIAVEADMSHAGMSPLFGTAKEVQTGRYQAHLEFPMAGDWVVLLHITLPGGKKLERQMDLKGVRPN